MGTTMPATKMIVLILLFASTIVSLPTDDVLPESEFVAADAGKRPALDEDTFVKDFKKDGLNGGLKDLSAMSSKLGKPNSLENVIADAEFEAGAQAATMSADEYVEKICDGVADRGAGTDSKSTTLAALKSTIGAFDKAVGALPKSQPTEEDSRIVSALENLGMDEGHDWKASIKKYCAHGDYGQGLKESQPILKELKAGVKEFDKCMKCVCKHGVDHCVDRPLCIRSFEGITQVAGSISKAKGFLNENGELIEPLGQKHYAAIHRIMKHTAMKKKELHKRHGPNPTKKQFHEVFSENDEQSLVQVQGCHGMSAATAIEFKSGAISCGFDCNEYHGVQEASLSCTAFSE